MANPRQRVGGSFAPPLSDDILASYKAKIDALADSPIKDALGVLHNCCQKWWELPESTARSAPHPTGVATVRFLDEPIAKALFDHIPWRYELDAIQTMFDAIPADQRELRNMAFHLLWHVKELDLDREPLTSDKLTVPLTA